MANSSVKPDETGQLDILGPRGDLGRPAALRARNERHTRAHSGSVPHLDKPFERQARKHADADRARHVDVAAERSGDDHAVQSPTRRRLPLSARSAGPPAWPPWRAGFRRCPRAVITMSRPLPDSAPSDDHKLASAFRFAHPWMAWMHESSAVDDAGLQQLRHRIQNARSTQSDGRDVADGLILHLAIVQQYALNGPIGGAHAVLDVRAFERRPRCRRAAPKPSVSAQRHLGIGANIQTGDDARPLGPGRSPAASPRDPRRRTRRCSAAGGRTRQAPASGPGHAP